MPITDTDRHIIWSGIIVFNIFGLFGNLNVIYAHYRLKALRSKYGILLTMLVSAHTVCLLYELAGIAFSVSGVVIRKNSCFYFLAPYIFTYCFQVSLMAAISADMLFSIAAPLQHRMVRTRTYFTMLLIPGLIYGAVAVTSGVLYTDSTVIKMCNPPSSVPLTVTRIWHLIGLFFTIITIVCYVSAFSIIYRKYKNRCFSTGNIERKAMKSISIIIIVYICERQVCLYLDGRMLLHSRLIFIFLINYLDFSGYSRNSVEKIKAYMIFSALTVYSSMFYVCFARSSEYRRIFWEQIVQLFGCFGVKLKEDRFGHSTVDLRKTTGSRKSQVEIIEMGTSVHNSDV